MPDGTLLQWGNSQIGADASSSTINFDVSFTSESYGISFVFNYGTVNNAIVSIAAKGKTSVTVYRNSANSSAQLFSWLAVGRWK